MEPTTVGDCDLALIDLSARLQVAYSRCELESAEVLNRQCDRILDMRLALTKPRVKVGAP